MTTLSTNRPALEAAIFAEDLMIDSDTPNIRLHLRHKRLACRSSFSVEKTLLMMHGATYASGSLYDVPLDGISFLDFAAARGYDVYALDVRGYGGSTRPHEMEEPAENYPPLVRTQTAVRDLAAAVDFLRVRLKIEALNLFGMSWGGSVAGAYTAENNRKIRKLILLAPQWISSQPVRIDTGGKLGAYRVVPLDAVRERWLNAVPVEKRTGFLPIGWFEQWAEAAQRDDPWNHNLSSAMVRAPSGAVQDIRDFWAAGRRFYNPESIEAPVLLIHAEWDADVPLDLAQEYFRALSGSADRRWIEIAEGTHLVLLERNRMRAMRAAVSFLDEA
jgi:pimeloyl-ACP methyl ester carboxylesterase